MATEQVVETKNGWIVKFHKKEQVVEISSVDYVKYYRFSIQNGSPWEHLHCRTL